ncbi:GlxA family transcriptional regulator [Pseudoduganella sp. UC29_106]|uniref:GlxA family transcriptional regulator n=1 Tax=Pseudoduganella sp. UC29_106 TaxID=3374553 RepID=UPI003757DAB8
MSFDQLSRLNREQPLRVLLVNAGEPDSLTWSGLVQPLKLAQRILRNAFELAVRTPEQAASEAADYHLALLVGDEQQPPLPDELARVVIARCRQAGFWGGVGAGVLWVAGSGACAGLRIALPWSLYADTEHITERAILTPHLFEIDGRLLSCCGGSASLDFSLTLVECLFGSQVQAEIKEALCIDRVRGHEERQRVALQARFGALQPKLSEAVTLMEANIEEPLSTDDIASLVGLSRRQLERLFKQYLGSLPSRYYLELRLQRARQLLLETNHSIVQVGLMCGFSSGSHFSTAFGTLFGNTPREERQRKLAAS